MFPMLRPPQQAPTFQAMAAPPRDPSRRVVWIGSYKGATITLARSHSGWWGQGKVSTPWGVVTIEAHVPEGLVRWLALELIKARQSPAFQRVAPLVFEHEKTLGPTVSGYESGFLDELEKLGQNETFQKVTSQVDRIVNDPTVQQVASWIPIVGTAAKAAGVGAAAARGLGEGGVAGAASGALGNAAGRLGGAAGAALGLAGKAANVAGQLARGAAAQSPALARAAAARSAVRLAQTATRAPRRAQAATRLVMRAAAGDASARKGLAELAAQSLAGHGAASRAWDDAIAALAQLPLGGVPVPSGQINERLAPPPAALTQAPPSWQSYIDPERYAPSVAGFEPWSSSAEGYGSATPYAPPSPWQAVRRAG